MPRKHRPLPQLIPTQSTDNVFAFCLVVLSAIAVVMVCAWGYFEFIA